MSTTTPDPAQRLYDVLQTVRPLHRVVAQAVADRLTGTGVTVASRAVLERLHVGGPQTVPRVCADLGLPRQAVQRVVNDLLGLGLVAVHDNPAHRRSHLLAVTDLGAARLAAIRAVENDSLATAAATIAPDDVEAALRVLGALTDHFRAVVDAARATGTNAPDQTPDVDDDVRSDLVEES